MFGFGKKTKKYEDIDALAFKALREKEDAVVLDVRSPAEVSEGVVPDYTMINFTAPSFRDEIRKLDKSKTYLLYCRSGNRSGQACRVMTDMGFEKLYNLQGGIKAWNKAFGKS